VSKGSSARIVVDLYPYTIVRLAGLLQRKGDVAKLSPIARIEQVRFRVLQMLKSRFHHQNSLQMLNLTASPGDEKQ
jgi:hypothetical protein